MEKWKEKFDLNKIFKFLVSDRGTKYVIVSILIIFTLVGGAEAVVNKLFLNDVYERNSQFLAEASKESRNTFLIVSTFKGLVSVIEGSQILGIEFGDIIEPVDDLIDIAWKMTMASLVSINLQRIILKIADDMRVYFTSVLSLGLICFIIEDFLLRLEIKNRIWNLFLRGSAFVYKATMILVIFISIFLPLLVHYSEIISNNFIDDQLNEAVLGIKKQKDKVNGELMAIKDEMAELKGWSLVKGESVDKMKDSLDRVFTLSPRLFQDSIEYLFWIIASFLLKVFIVPLGILLIEYQLFKFAMNYITENIIERSNQLEENIVFDNQVVEQG